MHAPVNVFFGMVNYLVCETLSLESLIGHERIGVDRAACLDVIADIGLESVFFTIADHSSPNFTTTLQDAHDGGFIFGASLSNPAPVLASVHESGMITDKSFVHFDFAIKAA